ncbi:hypothetical protein KP79_PYT00726 [Mizuhopecten yessoensis]|uniref:Uncharacterized protein n=1 Tax=Mizuhopecten yessoensis TaxID=6573 RepID=A0A210QS14_MIZYE|nr:hypothetical protein KP79_PYT00726 [Mizuhopecten yessoensis]
MRFSTVVVPPVILLLCVAGGYGASYNSQYGGKGESYNNQYGGYEVSYSDQYGGYGAGNNLYSGSQYGGQGYGLYGPSLNNMNSYSPIYLPPEPPVSTLYRERVLIFLAILLIPILGSSTLG